MGFLRFLLATLVLMGHINISIGGYHLGVIAVILFYLLAGQVVARLWSQLQSRQHALLLFARDRLLRIFPQYLAAMLLSSVLWLAGAESSFLSGTPDTFSWLANLLIIPLNFYMYNGLDTFTLVPPAWSLGAELQFYLLAPLILSLRVSAQRLCLLLSFLVYCLAQLQLLDPDHYGYRLIPGVLFIFMLGAVFTPGAALFAQQRGQRVFWGIAWLLLCAYAAILLLISDHVHFRFEVALGLALGVPLMVGLRRLRFQRPLLYQLDRRAGELSYGVFLFHYPALWMLQMFGFTGEGLAAFPLVLAVSVLLALAGHWLIERPVWRFTRPRLYS